MKIREKRTIRWGGDGARRRRGKSDKRKDERGSHFPSRSEKPPLISPAVPWPFLAEKYLPSHQSKSLRTYHLSFSLPPYHGGCELPPGYQEIMSSAPSHQERSALRRLPSEAHRAWGATTQPRGAAHSQPSRDFK